MQYQAGNYDIIVVGAGHAGCEAALAAARLGCRTLLLTLSLDHVALMPCNPSIGGPAKGQVVREIDALGGQMGINTDRTLIQIRLLNTSKGPAVQSLRAQSDKYLYRRTMKQTLENQENLTLKQDTVTSLCTEQGRVSGVRCVSGAEFSARAVVLTTGTYLRSRTIIGDVIQEAGPNHQPNAAQLSQSLSDMGLKLFRFKTGTPARADRRSINFDRTQIQEGSREHLCFSFLTTNFNRPSVPCYLTYTNARTHEIIRRNIHLAPLFSGVIEGVGTRYCPSIEDKVIRFPQREAHQLFLEPEGLHTNEIYVQGMSTSLPLAVQEQFLRTIPGLEQVEIMRPGYAIEYDGVVPTQLTPSLEYRDVPGLFGAGQINGTSGYEEAAGQGLMAGINAAHLVKEKEPLILSRSESYIGVLIDDLVMKGTPEPYRLFTSRAEYRLLLRNDNADRRLTPLGREIGLVGDDRWQRFEEKMERLAALDKIMEQSRFSGRDPVVAEYLEARGSAPLVDTVSGRELLKRPEVTLTSLLELDGLTPTWPEEVLREEETEIKYEGYLKKMRQHVERMNKLERRALPSDIDYNAIGGLRIEAQEKLARLRPYTVGQAQRISGVSPADISVLLIWLEEARRREQRNEI